MTKSAAASPDAPPAAAPDAETTPAAESTPAADTTPAAESLPVAEPPPAAAADAVGADAAGAAASPAEDEVKAQDGVKAEDGVKAKTSDITAGPGGVMTDEVGVITGDLTLRSELDGAQLTLRVQYKEAEEWYVVTGGKTKLADPADLDAVHQIAVGILNRPEG